MIGSISLTEILRTISSNLQTPVNFMLVLLMIVTVIAAGTLVGEILTERIYFQQKKIKLPELVEEMRRKEHTIEVCIQKESFLKRHKTALIEMTKHPELSDAERESLAVRLLSQEKILQARRILITDLIAKFGPMLGLMGTLIPLGPGIIALGQGDTYTLANKLMVAFDTTVAGLACAVVALLISAIRKNWYKNDISILETLLECILEEVSTDDQKIEA